MTGQIKDADFILLINKISDLMDSTSEFISTIGTLEKANPEYSTLIESVRKNPEQIDKILSEIPPEKATTFFGIFMKVAIIFKRYKKEDLTPDEKIELGSQLKKVSEELKAIV